MENFFLTCVLKYIVQTSDWPLIIILNQTSQPLIIKKLNELNMSPHTQIDLENG